jgi:hypothetical protein
MKQDFAGSDTIADVKLKIVDEEGGFPADFESLTFSYLLGSFVFTVHIAFLSGKTIVVDVPKKDIIYNVKTRIQNAAGIPVDQQRLMYVDQELHDGRAVDDYLIPDNATLQLVRALAAKYADFQLRATCLTCSRPVFSGRTPFAMPSSSIMRRRPIGGTDSPAMADRHQALIHSFCFSLKKDFLPRLFEGCSGSCSQPSTLGCCPVEEEFALMSGGLATVPKLTLLRMSATMSLFLGLMF